MRIAQVNFCRETSIENKQFKGTKTLISNLCLIRKTVKDIVVNRALPSLHGGSLEITLTDYIYFL